MNVCEICEGGFSGRSDARYCSAKCKQKATRARAKERVAYRNENPDFWEKAEWDKIRDMARDVAYADSCIVNILSSHDRRDWHRALTEIRNLMNLKDHEKPFERVEDLPY